MDAEKPSTSRRGSVRERKMALQQDVDKLKKRLRHEENVHRALERAFTRPLGSLPRLPPYLPPHTLELLAEVAVLEEEVVRLEEKIKYLKTKQSDSSLHTEANSPTIVLKTLPSLSDERRGKENQSSTNSLKNKRLLNSKVQPMRTRVKKSPIGCTSGKRHSDPQISQLESQVMDHETSEEKIPVKRDAISPIDDSPNKISESILKCLMKIFLRMSSKKNSTITETLPAVPVLHSLESLAYAECNDPYDLCSKFGKREIGPYKHLVSIEASSINPNRTAISVFLVQRLKLLLQRLATVDLKGLSHQEKLAFWINIYNSCMMNAFIAYGIPDSPEMVVELMQKATVNVGGHILNAITIEHFILRLPYHSQYTFSKGTKYDTRGMLGLEISEPLVTFALSCGSWSSPAVRVYTACQVENELETAKRDYLQAAVGISNANKVIAIPKLLDWYLLDFAKDLESLLDWICLQLPSELGKEAMKCIENMEDEPHLQTLHIIPYEFSFRYLFQT
ncbi:uncharacterized protein LOC105159187 isoform X2 [Sesamum indicum]|uniref:Uncharacterized protein LOC105159187 isoform X2 n=1 Tax=Sesamum indicum TaxID=4182 RepID=A0A6I9SXZ9_SESIN|nr:uncharacterized protein LOC105159187 isoform X2 [Sesamum indicum]